MIKTEKMINKVNKCNVLKEDYYPFLESYYESIGRTNPPNYKEYSLQELKKCVQLFKINLVREK